MNQKVKDFLKKKTLPEFNDCSAYITYHLLDASEEVYKAIKDFNSEEGWMCLTDEVFVIEKGYDFSKLSGRMPLSGEFVARDRSLHIRQSANRWELYEITRKNGGTQRMLKEKFLAVPRKGIAELQYETYWKEDEEGVFRPYVSRFIGFEKGGQ
jgi:hypothetical protein